MGYSEVQKGYILYDLTYKVFFVNGDVVFNETVFPFFKEMTTTDPVCKDTHPALDHLAQWTSIPVVTPAQHSDQCTNIEGLSNVLTREEDYIIMS